MEDFLHMDMTYLQLALFPPPVHLVHQAPCHSNGSKSIIFRSSVTHATNPHFLINLENHEALRFDSMFWVKSTMSEDLCNHNGAQTIIVKEIWMEIIHTLISQFGAIRGDPNNRMSRRSMTLLCGKSSYKRITVYGMTIS